MPHGAARAAMRGRRITPGSQTFTAPAETFTDSTGFSFVVPEYGTLIVECWGGGGPGGRQSADGGIGGAGRATTCLGMTAGGGGAGEHVDGPSGPLGGPGGGASGGDVNTAGETGLAGDRGDGLHALGGASPNSGVGRGPFNSGVNAPAPGTGHGGYPYEAFSSNSGGGGGGGYTKKTYTAGQLAVGSTVTGGLGRAGEYGGISGSWGGPGRVKFTWS